MRPAYLIIHVSGRIQDGGHLISSLHPPSGRWVATKLRLSTQLTGLKLSEGLEVELVVVELGLVHFEHPVGLWEHDAHQVLRHSAGRLCAQSDGDHPFRLLGATAVQAARGARA